MNNNSPENLDASPLSNKKPGLVNEQNQGMNRRRFVELTTSAALAFSIVPRHVLGGKNYVAPSDKITLAYIGTGTQGLREMLPMLATPDILGGCSV